MTQITPSITDTGIAGYDPSGQAAGTGGGFSFNWDQFNAIGPGQQQQFLSDVGFNPQQSKQFLTDFNNMEQDEYKAWVWNKFVAGTGAEEKQRSLGYALFHMFGTDTDLSRNKFFTPQTLQSISQEILSGKVKSSDQHEQATLDQIAQDIANGQAPAYLTGGGSPSGGSTGIYTGASQQQIMKNLGLSNLISTTGTQAAANAAQGISQAGTSQNAYNAPMSYQALENYRNAIIMPLIQNYQSMINGDMAQWGGMINQIKKDTAGADVNFNGPNLQLLGQLQNLYGYSSIMNQVAGPYFQAIDQQIGAATKVGMAKEAAGTAQQVYQQYQNQDPSLAAIATGTSLGGIPSGTNLAPTTPGTSNNTIANMVQAGIAKAGVTNPQQLPAYGLTPGG